jgi:hypothetical protein
MIAFYITREMATSQSFNKFLIGNALGYSCDGGGVVLNLVCHQEFTGRKFPHLHRRKKIKSRLNDV